MDDRFMNELRREPDPAFAAGLRERLERGEPARAPRAWHWRPMLAVAAAVAVVVALFAFPSVRVSAQSVLDLFRVRNFAAVRFDPARLEKLQGGKHGDPMMLFGTEQVLQKPGETQTVASPQAAGAIAGITVRVPGDLPRGLTLRAVKVSGPAAGRYTPDAAKLRRVLADLDIRDLDVPPSIDGSSVTVRRPAIVVQDYASARHHATLMQGAHPQVELPAGVDLGRLAEIGMRILGVDAGEARRLAGSIDWHSTVLVPVPPEASSFRAVEVNGNHGLIVTTSRSEHPRGDGNKEVAGDALEHGGSVVLWSTSDRVYALVGNLDDVSLLQMAQSVR